MDLDLLSQMLRQHFGWKSSTNIERVAARLATNLPPEMLAKVAVDNYTPEVIEAIATVLAIHESYFFRDPALFDLLADVFREQAQPGRTITIWSAGCAKGEEAYSPLAPCGDSCDCRASFVLLELTCLRQPWQPLAKASTPTGLYAGIETG